MTSNISLSKSHIGFFFSMLFCTIAYAITKQALMSMFQVLTQEGWFGVHIDLMDSVSLFFKVVVVVYFYLFHFVVNGVSLVSLKIYHAFINDA